METGGMWEMESSDGRADGKGNSKCKVPRQEKSRDRKVLGVFEDLQGLFET